MGKIYRRTQFEDIQPGDILVSLNGMEELEVVSRDEQELRAVVRRAERGTGVAGLVGVNYMIEQRYWSHNWRKKI